VTTLTLVLPILPDKEEAWRRFYQELSGARRSEYEESRLRLGITKERACLSQTPQGERAIVSIEVEEPTQVIPKLAASDLPFDGWFRKQLLELYGCNLTQQNATPVGELIFVWSVSS
jgi:hypothetical protein